MTTNASRVCGSPSTGYYKLEYRGNVLVEQNATGKSNQLVKSFFGVGLTAISRQIAEPFEGCRHAAKRRGPSLIPHLGKFLV